MALRATCQKLPKDIFFSDKYLTIEKKNWLFEWPGGLERCELLGLTLQVYETAETVLGTLEMYFIFYERIREGFKKGDFYHFGIWCLTFPPKSDKDISPPYYQYQSLMLNLINRCFIFQKTIICYELTLIVQTSKCCLSAGGTNTGFATY